MNKVFIVIEVTENAVLRVFGNYLDAIAYGNELIEGGVIDEFDVYEREVY
jgi:hypothetical protein